MTMNPFNLVRSATGPDAFMAPAGRLQLALLAGSIVLASGCNISSGEDGATPDPRDPQELRHDAREPARAPVSRADVLEVTEAMSARRAAERVDLEAQVDALKARLGEENVGAEEDAALLAEIER